MFENFKEYAVFGLRTISSFSPFCPPDLVFGLPPEPIENSTSFDPSSEIVAPVFAVTSDAFELFLFLFNGVVVVPPVIVEPSAIVNNPRFFVLPILVGLRWTYFPDGVTKLMTKVPAAATDPEFPTSENPSPLCMNE